LRKTLIAALVAVFVLGISAAAYATFEQEFTQSFDVTKKNKATGIKTLISSKDTDPNAVPKEVSKVIIKFHKGTKFNWNVPTQCKLTATQIETAPDPAKACPAKSKVGDGIAEAMVPGILPKTTEIINAFNTKKGIFFVLTDAPDSIDPAPGQTLVIKGTLSGTSSPVLTTVVPPLQITPINPVILTKFQLTINKMTKKVKQKGRTVGINYATTPNKCPATKKWTNVATFEYRDGSPSETINATTKCS
jgi:hypothetical protein